MFLLSSFKLNRRSHMIKLSCSLSLEQRIRSVLITDLRPLILPRTFDLLPNNTSKEITLLQDETIGKVRSSLLFDRVNLRVESGRVDFCSSFSVAHICIGAGLARGWILGAVCVTAVGFAARDPIDWSSGQALPPSERERGFPQGEAACFQ